MISPTTSATDVIRPCPLFAFLYYCEVDFSLRTVPHCSPTLLEFSRWSSPFLRALYPCTTYAWCLPVLCFCFALLSGCFCNSTLPLPHLSVCLALWAPQHSLSEPVGTQLCMRAVHWFASPSFLGATNSVTHIYPTAVLIPALSYPSCFATLHLPLCVDTPPFLKVLPRLCAPPAPGCSHLKALPPFPPAPPSRHLIAFSV